MTQSRIYTKLGDDGSTGLLFGGRTSKADPLIDVIGSIDETVAALGMARAASSDASLSSLILRVQRDLFVAAADLAANPRSRDRLVPGTSLLTAEMIVGVESQIDRLIVEHPLRPVFVVPGANPVSAALDLARTVVRRAERSLTACRVRGNATTNPDVAVYLNRCADLLYVLARYVAGDDEPASHDPGRLRGLPRPPPRNSAFTLADPS